MADASLATTLEITPQKSDSESIHPDSLHISSCSSSSALISHQSPSISSNSYPVSVNPPSVSYFAPPTTPSGIVLPPSAPSFRPAIQLPMSVLQPPGVNSAFSMATIPPAPPFQLPPGQIPYPAMAPYAPPHNGYLPIPAHVPQGSIHPGIPRFPPLYAPGVRPPFPLRPPGTVVPMLPRAPITGIRGPIISPILRPALIPSVTPAEKPQTTVYVGKIAPSVENDFILSLLNLCGTVKCWKRAQNPSDGTPGGFGFCEFDSAEGVLRALRLLSKFKIDGQELMLNVNQATRKSLEDYVEKKSESTKKDEKTDIVLENDQEEVDVENHDPVVSSGNGLKKNIDDYSDKDKSNSQFGIITSEEKDADVDVLGKLKCMIEERLKAKPLPPPPPPPRADHIENPNLETQVKARDNESDAEISKNDMAHDKREDSTSDTKHTNDQDKTEPRSPERSRREIGSPERGRREHGSPERSRRYDRGSRDRDRDRDLRREKEREIERYERERERERVKRERDRESRTREAEQIYRERVKDWELREREKEYHRLQEKNREKDKQHQRRKEIRDQERESDEGDDDESSRKHRRKLEEKRKKRLREKDEDLADRLKEEEEEIAEAERRAEEEHKQLLEKEKSNLMALSSPIANGSIDIFTSPERKSEGRDMTEETTNIEPVSDHADETGEELYGDEANAASDGQQFAPTKKLGFGLLGLGKRATVPSVFNAEDDDGHEEKKLRPLVPIDYSTEELHAVQHDMASDVPAHVIMEPPKKVSSTNVKEEKNDIEREPSRYTNDRHSYQDRDRNDTDYTYSRDGNRDRDRDRDRDREHRSYKLKAADNKKLLDAKQLIDMIPKTKDELFSYDINWTIYDKHELQERMRPWIAKKITEFLGEEETSLVDYIVSSMQNHVKAGKMLHLLHSILDDEAEMFVLKMWRMLIFEIKRVETGLSNR